VRAKTLFATHYHELTALADHLDRVANVHVAVDDGQSPSSASGTSSRTVDDSGADVTFLRTIEPGAADRSYGVHVADLAGVPDPVVDRAEGVLERLRGDEAIDVRGGAIGGESGAGDTHQVVFDLDSGGFRTGASADGGASERSAGTTEASPEAASAGTGPDGESDSGVDPAAASVLAELRDLDVDETPPVELLSRVAEWQAELDAE
jgi:DNA mismatch repair protein MutS